MGEILVRNAIDRSKYPKAMMYVDGQGNICKASSQRALSEEEKLVRDKKRTEYFAHKQKLKHLLHKARYQAKSSPTIENKELLEKAAKAYNDIKKISWREYGG